MPGRWNQRYCREPECLREVHRWQAAKRQRRRRATAEGRQRHAEAERKRRKEQASRGERPERSKPPDRDAAGEAGAWSRSNQNLPEDLCDRPGCYEPPRDSPRTPSRYCGDACRSAMRQVRDRERKHLARNGKAGRRRRRRGVLRAAAKRRRQIIVPKEPRVIAPVAACSADAPRSVFDYRRTVGSPLGFVGPMEASTDDSQTTAGPRSRAPPAG